MPKGIYHSSLKTAWGWVGHLSENEAIVTSPEGWGEKRRKTRDPETRSGWDCRAPDSRGSSPNCDCNTSTGIYVPSDLPFWARGGGTHKNISPFQTVNTTGKRKHYTEMAALYHTRLHLLFSQRKGCSFRNRTQFLQFPNKELRRFVRVLRVLHEEYLDPLRKYSVAIKKLGNCSFARGVCESLLEGNVQPLKRTTTPMIPSLEVTILVLKAIYSLHISHISAKGGCGHTH